MLLMLMLMKIRFIPFKMYLTRMLALCFSFVTYSQLNVGNMTPPQLFSPGTFITAYLDRIRAVPDSGHFALNLTSILVNPISLVDAAGNHIQLGIMS